MYHIILMLCTVMFLACLFFLIKNETTIDNRMKIVDMIYLYQINCIRNNIKPVVDFCDMESYEKTLFRFWDFGCEHILPKEKFDIVKTFL